MPNFAGYGRGQGDSLQSGCVSVAPPILQARSIFRSDAPAAKLPQLGGRAIANPQGAAEVATMTLAVCGAEIWSAIRSPARNAINCATSIPVILMAVDPQVIEPLSNPLGWVLTSHRVHQVTG